MHKVKKVVHKLRNQPEHARRHILHLSTMFLGLILVSLWVYSLGTRVTNSDTNAKIKEDLAPLTVLKDNTIEGYNSINQ